MESCICPEVPTVGHMAMECHSRVARSRQPQVQSGWLSDWPKGGDAWHGAEWEGGRKSGEREEHV